MTPKVRPLESGYSAQTTRCDETSWGKIVGGFDDASLYQTWTYDAVRRRCAQSGPLCRLAVGPHRRRGPGAAAAGAGAAAGCGLCPLGTTLATS